MPDRSSTRKSSVGSSPPEAWHGPGRTGSCPPLQLVCPMTSRRQTAILMARPPARADRRRASARTRTSRALAARDLVHEIARLSGEGQGHASGRRPPAAERREAGSATNEPRRRVAAPSCHSNSARTGSQRSECQPERDLVASFTGSDATVTSMSCRTSPSSACATVTALLDAHPHGARFLGVKGPTSAAMQLCSRERHPPTAPQGRAAGIDDRRRHDEDACFRRQDRALLGRLDARPVRARATPARDPAPAPASSTPSATQLELADGRRAGASPHAHSRRAEMSGPAPRRQGTSARLVRPSRNTRQPVMARSRSSRAPSWIDDAIVSQRHQPAHHLADGWYAGSGVEGRELLAGTGAREASVLSASTDEIVVE